MHVTLTLKLYLELPLKMGMTFQCQMYDLGNMKLIEPEKHVPTLPVRVIRILITYLVYYYLY